MPTLALAHSAATRISSSYGEFRPRPPWGNSSQCIPAGGQQSTVEPPSPSVSVRLRFLASDAVHGVWNRFPLIHKTVAGTPAVRCYLSDATAGTSMDRGDEESHRDGSCIAKEDSDWNFSLLRRLTTCAPPCFPICLVFLLIGGFRVCSVFRAIAIGF